MSKNEVSQMSHDARVAWTIAQVILILALIISIAFILMWIYNSKIKRKNSKDYTGKDITNYIFDKRGVEVNYKESYLYVKFWNYYKKKKLYRIRPWTASRKSLWTLMDASQQAYVTTAIERNEKKQLWGIFWAPLIIVIVGYVLCGVFLVADAKTLKNYETLKGVNWTWMSLAIASVIFSHSIADFTRIVTVWRKVMPLLKETGLTKRELITINVIFFLRSLLSIISYFLTVKKIFVKLSLKFYNWIIHI
ncbi:hypothetical protein [Mycoplasma todarodis]|uniref:hypothetical protein n=1 Tax=Mycoplasma todarodis TaxID=1937191 RepID=UPI003B368B72